MRLRHYPATAEVHGTVDPDTLGPEPSIVDRPETAALLEAFNTGVRRARASAPTRGYTPPDADNCHWCAQTTTGACKRHKATA